MVNFLDPRLPDRFWSKVQPCPMTGCWLFVGANDSDGYGSFKFDRVERAHRGAYRRLVGEIPAGLQLDHLCRVRCCVNPAHLEAVTSRENTLRGDTLPATNARASQCPAGHPYDVVNTIRKRNGGRNCRECTKRWRRERRVALMAAGFCVGGRTHGAAVKNQRCAECAELQNEQRRKRRAARRVSLSTIDPDRERSLRQELEE